MLGAVEGNRFFLTGDERKGKKQGWLRNFFRGDRRGFVADRIEGGFGEASDFFNRS